MYDVSTREMRERRLLCVKRNVANEKAAWAFGKEFIALLRRYQLPQIPRRAGAFFGIVWGEISAESDGPMDLTGEVGQDTYQDFAIPSNGRSRG